MGKLFPNIFNFSNGAEFRGVIFSTVSLIRSGKREGRVGRRRPEGISGGTRKEERVSPLSRTQWEKGGKRRGKERKKGSLLISLAEKRIEGDEGRRKRRRMSA